MCVMLLCFKCSPFSQDHLRWPVCPGAALLANFLNTPVLRNLKLAQQCMLIHAQARCVFIALPVSLHP